MAESSFPFEVSAGAAGDVNEDGWTQMVRLFSATGVVGDPGSTALQPFGDSSGMVVSVRAGRAMVRGEFYLNDATKTISIPANSSGSTRLDRIVLEVNPTANTVTAIRSAGSTSLPSLTQTDVGTYQMPLAKVTVPNGAVTITSGNVVDDRPHINTDVIPCRVVADVVAPRFGTLAAELSTGQVKWWNGSAWKSLTDKVVGDGLMLAAGSTVVTTDSGGYATIPIPSGMGTVISMTAMNGDSDTYSTTAIILEAGRAGRNSIYATYPQASSGGLATPGGVATLSSSILRVNWIMVGTPA